MSEYIVRETGFPGVVKQEIVGELVRCKDCLWRHDSLNCNMYSEGMDTPDDWFCADGERKKDV